LTYIGLHFNLVLTSFRQPQRIICDTLVHNQCRFNTLSGLSTTTIATLRIVFVYFIMQLSRCDHRNLALTGQAPDN